MALALDFLGADTPTAILVRQLLGAISQFEKATLVAKLKGARDRKPKETGRKVEGRPSHAEMNPEVVELARRSYASPTSRGTRALMCSAATSAAPTCSRIIPARRKKPDTKPMCLISVAETGPFEADRIPTGMEYHQGGVADGLVQTAARPRRCGGSPCTACSRSYSRAG